MIRNNPIKSFKIPLYNFLEVCSVKKRIKSPRPIAIKTNANIKYVAKTKADGMHNENMPIVIDRIPITNTVPALIRSFNIRPLPTYIVNEKIKNGNNYFINQ